MQTPNKIFDDLAKVAGGAASSFSGLKNELEAIVRQQIQRLMADVDAVPRDEFEAVKAVAAKARSEQEKLEERVAALEARPEAKTKKPAKPRAKKPAEPKSGPNETA